ARFGRVTRPRTRPGRRSPPGAGTEPRDRADLASHPRETGGRGRAPRRAAAPPRTLSDAPQHLTHGVSPGTAVITPPRSKGRHTMAKREIVSEKLRTPPGVFSHATM